MPKQGVRPTLLPTHLLSKPMIPSVVGGCGGAPKIACLTSSMSFLSSKPRVASEHCSPKKMDEAKKNLMNSLGRSPRPPDTSSEASYSDCHPGKSLILRNSCNQGPEKDSTFIQATGDVFAPGASNILAVSAKSSSFFYHCSKMERPIVHLVWRNTAFTPGPSPSFWAEAFVQDLDPYKVKP